MVDIPGDATTTTGITVDGQTVTNTLEVVGDHDWIRINLVAGQAITVTLNGITLVDPYLRIRDASGAIIYENDDVNTGVNLNSRLSFAAPTTGVYYIDVGAYNDAGAGDYQVTVTTWTQPPIFNNDQIATQLASGYWGDGTHAFTLDASRTITVNITGLNAQGQALARAALLQWGEIAGINFVETSGTAKITFNDDDTGAYTDSNYANGVISSSFINIDSQWLMDYGPNVGSYAYQAYLHEIGHALGLGHAGNYNTTATYPYDVLFRNDAWSTSVMSYFDQVENTYFSGQGFSQAELVTPMVADIVAIGQLYGLSTTTRSGDTTYGLNSNAGGIYDASGNNVTRNNAYTIFDTGGVDTLDYSFTTNNNNQVINLNPETFSNINGRVGNVAIARGTIIENAIGGTQHDTIIGNSANNTLNGMDGADTISGNDGDDTLIGGVGVDALDGGAGNDRIFYDPADNPSQVNGGSGFDLLIVDNLAAPTSYNLIARGFEGAEVIQTDTGGNPWSSIVKAYDSSWAMLSQTTNNDDGTRVIIQLDPYNTSTTNQTWNTYDALGRLSSMDVLYDNGTRTFINLDENNAQPWSQDWFTYDTQGRLNDFDRHYDNGTRLFVNFDQDNTQIWSQDWFTYDAQGRLDSVDRYFDDGIRTFINFDQDNTQIWNQDWFTYDSLGRLSSQDRYYDDGTRTFINFDENSSQPWTQAWFTYDAQGRLDTQDVFNDDGSRAFYNHDQDSSQPWTWVASLYNNTGFHYSDVIFNDNGTTSYFYY